MWALRQLKSLTSVEHDQLWAATLQKHLERTMPQLKSKWTCACTVHRRGDGYAGRRRVRCDQGQGEARALTTALTLRHHA